MRFAAKTDIGKLRDLNEDCYAIITDCPGITAAFIVADGMGGHNSGEVASRIAVDEISSAMKESLASIPDEEKKDLSKLVGELIVAANRVIYNKSEQRVENRGMGTTIIVAVIADDIMHIGHVGDSRLYLIRNKVLQKITTDHSYIEELVKKGTLTREEAEHHPQRNIITRALGLPGDIEVDTFRLQIESDDRIIICTDGLTTMIDEDDILNLAKTGSPEEICDKLITAANNNGGEDNITVVIIHNDN